MSSLNPAETAILRTAAYFDVFDYPLTRDEAWRWAYPTEPKTGLSREEAESAVSGLILQGRLSERDGFLFLPGRESLVALRRERREIGRKKWKKAYAAARFLELVPFVKMVGVTNTLALDNARDESDIDFFIIVSPRHMWLARMMVTGIISMLGYRRSGGRETTNIKNKVCLSFYVTTAAMDLAKFRSAPADDHLMFWTSQIVPIMDDRTYEKFTAANGWVTERLPNAWPWDWKQRLLKPNGALRTIKRFYEPALSTSLGAYLESMARDYQLKRFDRDTLSKSHLGTTDVVINEDVLKFHEADRRAEYNAKFAAKLKELRLE